MDYETRRKIDHELYELRRAVEQIDEERRAINRLLNDIKEGPYRMAQVVAGPAQNLYSLKFGNECILLPKHPEIANDLPAGTWVMFNNHVIVSILDENLIQKEVPVPFDFIDWSEIGGMRSQLEKIRDIVETPFTHAEEFKMFGLKPSRGVLLYGAPGCGKTLIAKAIASFFLKNQKISQDSFIYIKGGELLSKYIGESEARIKGIFDRARENYAKTGQRSVIFIDEAEAIVPARGTRRSSDVDTTIVPSFLSEMDGFNASETFMILATNFKNQLDPAVIRPGRIDLHVEITFPDKTDAEEIFAIHLAKTKVDGDPKVLACNAAELLFGAKNTQKPSGAIIANVVQKATAIAIKRVIKAKESGNRTPKGVTLNDVLEAIKEL